MRMTPEHVLQALRDIDGVYGSFWVAASGEVIARDISPVIASNAIGRAGLSLAHLWQSLAPLEAEELCLTFSAHQLFFVRLPESTLCIFAALRADLAALRAMSQRVRPRLEQAHGVAGGRPGPPA
jgi:hypothetical protein